MFTLSFETTNDAFTDGYKGFEVTRILHEISKRVGDVDDDRGTSGVVYDINGNKIGSWALTAE